MKDTQQRLEYLRGELRAGTMSYGDLVELQSLARHIDRDDVELLEAAGVPEGQAESSPTNNESLRENALLDELEHTVEHKMWHELSCPAHSNQMRPESECNCQIDLMRDFITAHRQDSKKGGEDETTNP